LEQPREGASAERGAVLVHVGVTTCSQRNAVSATRLATGNYEVVFDRDIRGCAYLATAGKPGGGNPTSGQIAVAQRNGNPNAVYVDTRDSADRFFRLAVVC
jgi:hypothetical protein